MGREDKKNHAVPYKTMLTQNNLKKKNRENLCKPKNIVAATVSL